MRVFVLSWLLALLLGQAGQAQKTDSEQLYVINGLGAALYSMPSFNAPLVGTAVAGSSIEVIERLPTDQKRDLGETWSLEGDFIKIVHGLQYAYVFSSDLGDKPVSLVKAFREMKVPMLLGKQLDKKEVTRTISIDDKSYDVTDKITTYEYGTYTYYMFDGCSNDTYEIKGLTLTEVYHQLRNSNTMIVQRGEVISLEMPWFVEKQGNKYLFGVDGATEELQIVENEDGSYTISSYACT